MLTVANIFECDICKKTEGNTTCIPQGGQLPNPVLPEGWTHINDTLICDEHIIEIKSRSNPRRTQKVIDS